MTCNLSPSEHLISTRDRLKPFVHGGKYFSSGEISALVRRLNTSIALAEELEAEIRLMAKTESLAKTIVCAEAYGDKVAVLKPRPRKPTPSTGGDAA